MRGWLARNSSPANSRQLGQRALLLDNIGFEWDPRESMWEVGLNALLKFIEREGHCKVPTSHLESGYNLGGWVDNQRTTEEIMSAERWPQIHAAWDTFAHFLSTDTPPPLTAKDVRIRDDAVWRAAAEAYVEAKAAVDGAAVLLDAAKETLVALAGHTSEQGNGVTVTQYVKDGAVDYKKVPELKGVDLERYRGAARQEVRVTLSKMM